MKVALIDADSLIYKVGFALEDKIQWEDNEEPSFYSNIEEHVKSI